MCERTAPEADQVSEFSDLCRRARSSAAFNCVLAALLGLALVAFAVLLENPGATPSTWDGLLRTLHTVGSRYLPADPGETLAVLSGAALTLVIATSIEGSEASDLRTRARLNAFSELSFIACLGLASLSAAAVPCLIVTGHSVPVIAGHSLVMVVAGWLSALTKVDPLILERSHAVNQRRITRIDQLLDAAGPAHREEGTLAPWLGYLAHSAVGSIAGAMILLGCLVPSSALGEQALSLFCLFALGAVAISCFAVWFRVELRVTKQFARPERHIVQAGAVATLIATGASVVVPTFTQGPAPTRWGLLLTYALGVALAWAPGLHSVDCMVLQRLRAMRASIMAVDRDTVEAGRMSEPTDLGSGAWTNPSQRITPFARMKHE